MDGYELTPSTRFFLIAVGIRSRITSMLYLEMFVFSDDEDDALRGLNDHPSNRPKL